MNRQKIAGELIKIAGKLVGFNFRNKDNKYKYMLLSRMQADCEYYLKWGGHSPRHLWAGSIKKQIKAMKELYKSFSSEEKPKWISWEDILMYEKEMSELG